MTLASLHQVLTLRMSPSPRHPSASPHGRQQPARPSHPLHPCPLGSHSPPCSSPSSVSASTPGPSLHLLGWREGTQPHSVGVRLACMCAACARALHGTCACLAHGACDTSALWHGPEPRMSRVGPSADDRLAGLPGAGQQGGIRTSWGSTGRSLDCSPRHQGFPGRKSSTGASLIPAPLCPAHPRALAGSLFSPR